MVGHVRPWWACSSQRLHRVSPSLRAPEPNTPWRPQSGMYHTIAYKRSSPHNRSTWARTQGGGHAQARSKFKKLPKPPCQGNALDASHSSFIMCVVFLERGVPWAIMWPRSHPCGHRCFPFICIVLQGHHTVDGTVPQGGRQARCVHRAHWHHVTQLPPKTSVCVVCASFGLPDCTARRLPVSLSN